jgi:hypothetical protein
VRFTKTPAQRQAEKDFSRNLRNSKHSAAEVAQWELAFSNMAERRSARLSEEKGKTASGSESKSESDSDSYEDEMDLDDMDVDPAMLMEITEGKKNDELERELEAMPVFWVEEIWELIVDARPTDFLPILASGIVTTLPAWTNQSVVKWLSKLGKLL